MRFEHVHVSLPGRPLPAWKLALIAAAGAVLLVAIAVLAFAAFVVVAPIVAALVGWQAWRLGRAARKNPPPRRDDVVDAEFVMIERPKKRGPEEL